MCILRLTKNSLQDKQQHHSGNLLHLYQRLCDYIYFVHQYKISADLNIKNLIINPIKQGKKGERKDRKRKKKNTENRKKLQEENVTKMV